MTAPNGAIVFNNTAVNGDTQASGLGPATAVFGSTGSCTSGSAVVTGIDTTGVTAGDLFWGQTTSGRQFSIIASVDSGVQVTLDDTLSATHAANLTWAIGGKRATWDHVDSRALFTDAGSLNWTVETETDQTLTSAIDMTGTGLITIRGSGSALKTITQTVDQSHFTQGDSLGLRSTVFQWLKANNSFGGTKTKLSSFVYHDKGGASSLPVTFSNCEIGDATNTLYNGVRREASQAYFIFVDCYIHHCISNGVENAASSAYHYFTRCQITNNGAYGFNGDSATAPYIIAIACNFSNNASGGFRYSRSSDASFLSCVFSNNGGEGLFLPAGSKAQIVNCIFNGNGTYGINNSTGFGDLAYRSGNIYYDNTSGSLSTGSVSSEGYEATTDDPFTDSANYDFTLNDGVDATALKSATSAILSNTTSRPFRWLDNSTGGGTPTGSFTLNHNQNNPIAYPPMQRSGTYNVPQDADLQMSSDGGFFGVMGYCPKAGDIAKVWWYDDAGANGVVDVQVCDPTTNGFADVTSLVNTGAESLGYTTDNNSVNSVTLGTPATVTLGQRIAVQFTRNDATNGCGIRVMNGLWMSGHQGLGARSYSAPDGSTYSVNQIPYSIAVEYSDGTIWPMGCLWKDGIIIAPASGIEEGLLFQVPHAMTIVGVLFGLDLDGTAKINLYSGATAPGGTAIASSALFNGGGAIGTINDADDTTSACMHAVYFGEEIALEKNTDYRVVCEGDGTTRTFYNTYMVDDDAWRNAWMPNWQRTTDDGAGGWTDAPAAAPAVALLVKNETGNLSKVGQVGMRRIS